MIEMYLRRFLLFYIPITFQNKKLHATLAAHIKKPMHLKSGIGISHYAKSPI